MPSMKKQEATSKKPETAKKPGRKPMTKAEKAAAAKQHALDRKLAENLVPNVVLQYQGTDTVVPELVERVKGDFKESHKRTLITALDLYVKPEERMAYYVINGKFNGELSF